MNVQILALAPSHHYPPEAQSATSIFVEDRSVFLAELGSDVRISEIPYLYQQCYDSAMNEISKTRPNHIFLITNAPSYLDFVLYRYVQNAFNCDFPDNEGGTLAPQEMETLIAKSASMAVQQQAFAYKSQGLTPVTLSMANDGGVEGYLFFRLAKELHDTEMIVSRIGVPPAVADDATLNLNTLSRTLAHLIKAHIELS